MPLQITIIGIGTTRRRVTRIRAAGGVCALAG
jgi:hypothetical protein